MPEKHDNWKLKVKAIHKIEQRAGKQIFSNYPYSKFLPLIFYPPQLNWSLAGKCNRDSKRRIVVLACGRDLLAFQGWFRLAVIAIYSLLLCPGIENYAIDLLLGNYRSEYRELNPDQFFTTGKTFLHFRLVEQGVKIRRIQLPVNTANWYQLYQKTGELLLRFDADAVAFPGGLNSCFKFNRPLGHSGLNARHTGRSGYQQLFNPDKGRMKSWSDEFRDNPESFLRRVCHLAERVMEKPVEPAVLAKKMQLLPWLSEGLSYLRPEWVLPFVELQNILVKEDIIPDWDEEVVKILLAGLFDLDPEEAQVPVLEYTEYNQQISGDSVVNFRNTHYLEGKVPDILRNRRKAEKELSYISTIINDLCQRRKKEWR